MTDRGATEDHQASGDHEATGDHEASGDHEKGLAHIGVRALRNSVSELVRRAARGERIVITVDGRPMAQLGPLGPDAMGLTLQDLAAAGMVDPPRREFEPALPAPYPVPADVRLDRLIDQIRGS